MDIVDVMNNPDIIVEVSGGVVTSVHSLNPNATVKVVDYDAIEEGLPHPFKDDANYSKFLEDYSEVY